MADRPSSRVLGSEANAVQRALDEPEVAPLAALLPGALDEERVPQMWRAVDFRLSSEAARGARKVWQRRALALAAALLLAVGALLWQRRAPGELRVEGQTRASTELESRATPSRVRFQDGSQVELGPFARLEVLRNDGRSFVTVLRRGKSSFDVQPGGPRHWVIEAGVASVEVVGTRFSVERGAASVQVTVERGIVLVRAESLPHGSVRLTAGGYVSIHAPTRDTETPALAQPTPVAPADLPLEHAGTNSAAPKPTQALPASSVSSPSPAFSGASNAEPDVGTVERALAEADAARQRGDRAGAVRHFEAAIAAASPSDPRRGMAALSLARLLLPTDPSKAAAVLARSFAAVPQALREDAWARRVEAEGRAGNLAEAARLADEYERRYPNGQRAEEVRRWRER